MKRIIERFQELIKNRIFVMLVCICLLFSLLSVRLFYLQIIHGEKFQQQLTTSVRRSIALPASRGSIYDRYGRPLAINHVAYSIKIDDSINLNLSDQRNTLVLDFYDRMKKQNQALGENMPISQTAPYTFQFPGNEKEKEAAEKAYKQKLGIEKSNMDMTAEETIAYMAEKYEIPDNYTMTEKRGLISLNSSLSDKNLMILSLIQVLTENGEALVDDLPISTEEPYQFLFDGNKSKEEAWKLTVNMEKDELDYNASETIEYLRDYFDLPEILPNDIIRKAISVRYAIFLERFYNYKSTTVALDVSSKTLAYTEETLPSVIVDTASLRQYPQGEYFSHILGYIRKMSEDDYAEYKDDKDSEGNAVYDVTDVVGKSGIEKLLERELNGQDGETLVEVDSLGRRMDTVEAKSPVSGNNVFLTLDSRLQEVASKSLENTLKGLLKRKLNSGGREGVTLQELFVTMINGNKLSISEIYGAQTGEQAVLSAKIASEYPGLTLDTPENQASAKQVITSGIESGTISPKQMVLVMIEQDIIPGDEDYKNRIINGQISPLTVINENLDSGELRPGETAVEPCTGSVVVSRVDSGEALALATYPSYDNNMLVNNFNNSYYNKLVQDVITTPMVNRPLRQQKAPGSTFKMIVALAGLETGVITPNTIIRDLGSYTKAGKPYAKCWIYGGGGGVHGDVNVAKALEVSCNYYFYETSYRLGNFDDGNALAGITTLNEYMAAFGLNETTGIELDSTMPIMASPQNKEHSIKTVNPDATESQTRWNDGDSIRTAIGQSYNSFTPAQMNKYIATLANGGTRYKMHLLSKIETADSVPVKVIDEVVENVIDLDPANLAAVYQGMYQVTAGTNGTLRSAFADFPIAVAGKSGTAQEDLTRASHTVFVGFAPYDDPQIAITVMIPFGEMSGAPAAVVAKDVIAEYMGLNYEPSNEYMETILAK